MKILKLTSGLFFALIMHYGFAWIMHVGISVPVLSPYIDETDELDVID